MSIPNTPKDPRLASIVERIENVEAEIKVHQEARKEIYLEAKSGGYDQKAIRELIAERKKDAEELALREANKDLYRQAILPL